MMTVEFTTAEILDGWVSADRVGVAARSCLQCARRDSQVTSIHSQKSQERSACGNDVPKAKLQLAPAFAAFGQGHGVVFRRVVEAPVQSRRDQASAACCRRATVVQHKAQGAQVGGAMARTLPLVGNEVIIPLGDVAVN
jgi:hypothetical protein